MTCNNCKYFSVGKLKVKAKYNYGRKYYFVWLPECRKLVVTLGTLKEDQGLDDIEIPNIFPVWNCPKLQELRKEDKIPHFELSIMKNGERMNDFSEWIKIN